MLILFKQILVDYIYCLTFKQRSNNRYHKAKSNLTLVHVELAEQLNAVEIIVIRIVRRKFYEFSKFDFVGLSQP